MIARDLSITAFILCVAAQPVRAVDGIPIFNTWREPVYIAVYVPDGSRLIRKKYLLQNKDTTIDLPKQCRLSIEDATGRPLKTIQVTDADELNKSLNGGSR